MSYSQYFKEHPYLRAVIEAVLEGSQGEVVRIPGQPDAVRLDLGCYAVPGGDPHGVGARELIRSVPTGREIHVVDDDWRALVYETLESEPVEAPMNAYLPGPELANRARDMARQVPEGYDILPLDASLAGRIDEGLTPNGLCVFGTPERLAAEGFGFVAVHGESMACLTTSYALSAKRVEISISTARAHRGRGLAACVAATMVNACLKQGLEPHWNASNPISQRLASRLGFVVFGVCPILRPMG